MKIGILGGTFNPVHYGHLIIAEAVRETYSLDRIIFIPNQKPPHKSSEELAPGKHRLKMVELAIANNPYFESSDIELERAGLSYSIDTIGQLQTTYGKKAEFYFIVGADTLLEISSWRDIDELVEMCNFIIVSRPGYKTSGLNTQQVSLKKETFDRLLQHVLDISPVDISATEIRHRVRSNRSIRHLVPKEVSDYIETKKLYSKN